MKEEGNNLYRIVFKITVRDKQGNVCEGYSQEYVPMSNSERIAWEDYITKSGAIPKDAVSLKNRALRDTMDSYNTSLKYNVTPVRVEEDDGLQ